MKQNKKYVLGVDFGTDSCRALVVDVSNGQELAIGISFYARWRAGLYCAPTENRYRQHPLDYLEAMTEAIREAVILLGQTEAAHICGLCFDTTGSTPVLTDWQGTPLALLPDFAEEPDAMFVLWKDHTAVREADKINALVKSRKANYTRYEGGTYSSEWVWAKVLHILTTNPDIKEKSYAWVEHCDWITGVVTGNFAPTTLFRSRCAAGHKAMWHEQWGLPSEAFLRELDPALAAMRSHLFQETYTSDTMAGALTAEWAGKLGLPVGIAVAVGALDAHMGAVGALVAPGILARIIGTSTCDIMLADKAELGGRCIEGICGQVDGSVIPGWIGLEAGQSAFGDIYAWFKELLAWPLRKMPESEEKQTLLDHILADLTGEAQQLPISEHGVIALDWLNGRRTPYADQHLKGILAGLTLGSRAPELFKALIEATAFGSKRIVDHFADQGIRIDAIHAIGGISKKSPFVMQVLADVLGIPIRVVASEQACALGSAMYAAVASGIYPTLLNARETMGSGFEAEYTPIAAHTKAYRLLYDRYLKIANFAEHLYD
ncbi:MAG: ribulokinase [Alistipes sp.]